MYGVGEVLRFILFKFFKEGDAEVGRGEDDFRLFSEFVGGNVSGSFLRVLRKISFLLLFK